MQAVGGFRQRLSSLLLYNCLLLWLQHGFSEALSHRCTDPSIDKSVRYNPTREICCLGSIHVRQDVYSQCCGSSVFNSSIEVCCDGHISSSDKGETECCGIQSYNPSLSTCCFQDGTESLYTGTGECCGENGLFDPSHHVCCYSFSDDQCMLHPLPFDGHAQCCGSDLYNPSQETCCRETSFQGIHDCCGSTPFSSTKELCCEGTVHLKSDGNGACCGDVPYNSRTETCCSGVLYDIADGACCWETAYDPLTSSCCDYTVISSLPEVAGIQECCEWQSYLSTEEICCQGQLFPRQKNSVCCGNASYDTSTHICCGDWYDTVILARTTDRTSCCGVTTFEDGTETCCYRTGQVFPVVNGSCCLMADGREEAFNSNDGICCSNMFEETFYAGYPSHQYQCCGSDILRGGELCDSLYQVPVTKSSSSDDSVCRGFTDSNSQTYNSVSNVCVNGVVMLLGASQGICRNQLIDTATEICCLGDFIYARYDWNRQERKCCEGSVFAYSPSEESCCGTVIYSIPEHEASCCGYQAYHTPTEVCEDGYLIRPRGKPHRCGDQYYNKEESSCCGVTLLVQPGFTCCDGTVHYTDTDGINNGGCCAGVGYNPGTYICCGTQLHERTREDLECCGNEALSPRQRRRHICCGGIFQPTDHGRKQCHGRVAYDPRRATVCDGVRYPIPYGTCCGSHLLNQYTEVCCEGNAFISNGSLSLSCCGAEVYDPADLSLLCCDSVLHQDVEGTRCCGAHVYDPNSQECCRGELQSMIYSSPRRDDRRCCDTLLYNSSKHQCCSGRLSQFRAGSPCCGTEVLTDPDDLCCEGNVTQRLYGADTQCCGTDIYNVATQACVMDDDGTAKIVLHSGSSSRNRHTEHTNGVCINLTSNMDSHLLTQAYGNHSTVVVISHPKMKAKRGREICRSRIVRVLKQAPGSGEIEGGAPVSFDPSCPCEGFRRAGVLFTDLGFNASELLVKEGDILVQMNKSIRQALEKLN